MQKFRLNTGRLCARSFCSSAGVPASSTPPPVPVLAKVEILGLGIFGFSLGTALMYWTDFLSFRTGKAKLAAAEEFSRTGKLRSTAAEEYRRGKDGDVPSPA